jgi:hypothetical protein
MKVPRKLPVIMAALALGVAPAIALAAGPGDHPTGPPSTVTTGPPATTPVGPPSTVTTGRPATTPPRNQGTAHKPAQPRPSASLPAKAKAYGKLCQGESKTHVAGTRGTPFSKCVTDMAKLAHGSTHNPRTACNDESKTHVAGTPGTPFSTCVSAGAKLLKNQADD